VGQFERHLPTQSSFSRVAWTKQPDSTQSGHPWPEVVLWQNRLTNNAIDGDRNAELAWKITEKASGKLAIKKVPDQRPVLQEALTTTLSDDELF
jgi:hypothetical protein